MSWSRFFSVFMARNKEFYRDKGALGWTFIFPIFVVFSFSYMFNIEDQGIYKIGYSGNTTPPKIEMVEWVSFPNSESAIKKLNVHALDLVIDFNQTPTPYWVSKTSPKSKVAKKLFLASRIEKYDGVVEKNVEGKTVNYVDWLLPGLLTMNTSFLALWGVGWVIVRQRKMGVLKRLKAAPVSSFEYLVAQMISRLIILTLSGIILYVGSVLIHPFEMRGSYIDFLLIYILGCLSLSSIGLVIASRITSDEFANGLINFIVFPMMFLSEVWFSLEGSPEWVHQLAKTVPLWHMTVAMRKVMNMGTPLTDLWPHLAFLSVTAILFTMIGSYFFKWTRD